MGKRKPKIDVPTRFSQFQAQTKISYEALTRIEQAAGGHIRVDAEGRAAILRALQEFEYLRTYESAGFDEPRRADLRNFAAVLEQTVKLARQLNESHSMWVYTAELANVEPEAGLDELKRLAAAARKTSERVEQARKVRGPDPWLPRLLLQLEEQYLRAGGKRTGVSNKAGKRGGRFVRFCDSVIGELPESCKPRVEKTGSQKSVGSLWASIYAQRRRPNKKPSKGLIIWLGKARLDQLKK